MLKKIILNFSLLDKSNFKKLIIIGFLIFFTLILELIGLGLIIPLIKIFSDQTFLEENLLTGFIINKFSLNYSNIIILSLLFITFVYVIKNIYIFSVNYIKYNFTYNIRKSLSNKLFNIYLNKNYLDFYSRNSSIYIRNIQEISIYTDVLNQILILATELLIIIGTLSILFYVEPIGSLVFIFFSIIAGYFLNKLTQKKLTNLGSRRQFHDAKKTQHLKQGIEAFKEVNIFQRNSVFSDFFKKHVIKEADSAKYLEIYLQFPRLWLEVIAITGMSIFIYILFKQSANFNEIIPSIGLFAVSGFKLIPSLNKTINAYQFINFYSSVSQNLVDEFGKADELHVPISDDINFKNNFDDIEFNQVSFSYGKKLILNDVNFRIKKNQYVGIIGPSGSGKSTLLNLILGFLIPINGKIKINGEILTSEKVSSFRKIIGYVPQNLYLLDDTIENNIKFGVDSSSEDNERVKKCLKDAHVLEFVNSLDLGIKTLVGEKGVNLSGGQAQRIAIARALYNDPEIIIFDEATSSLDPKTEEKIINEINELKSNKTIIFVTHRHKALKNCDVVYNISDEFSLIH